MSVVQALVLGIVQGITEFLPISSSGHLVIFPELLGWPLQNVAFDAVIHLATLLVIFVYFRQDILEVLRHHRRIVWMILLATISVGAVGLVLEHVESLRSLPVVFLSLAFWGIVLMIADGYAKRDPAFAEASAGRQEPRARGQMSDIGWRRTLLVGVAQAIALIPGTSRSGIAITTGLFAGLDRKLAARLAFLVGIPAIALAGGSKLVDIVSGTVELELLPLVVGFLAALVSGYLAVAFLMRLLERVGYFWFGLYRVLLATFLFLVWIQRVG